MLPILAAAILTVAACVSIGKLLLDGLAVRLYRGEHYLFSFVAGAACLSLLVFLLAAVRQARTGVFVAIALGAVALAVWRGRDRPRPKPLPPLALAWLALFLLLLIPLAFLYFCNALAPEVSPDGTAYHLGNVVQYLRHGGFLRLHNSLYASLSQGMEMLFLFAFSMGKHSAAALVHFAFWIALPLLMLSYSRRLGYPRAGVLGAVLVFASPVIGIDGSSAYNDVAAACTLFALFYSLQIWDETRQPKLLVIAGLLAGFAYALKYTAFLALPYALAFVAWKLRRGRLRMVAPLLTISLAASALIAPWMIKNWVLAANPLAPFFNSVFPNPYIHVSFELQYREQMRHYSEIAERWQLPVYWTVRGDRVGGLLGPGFLLAPLGLLALQSAAGARLLAAGILFVLPVFSNDGTRFLIPAAPFLAMAIGVALARWPSAVLAVALAHGIAGWPSVVQRYCHPWAWRLTQVPFQAALRKTPEKSYLRARLNGYEMARIIDEKVPPDGMVFTHSGVPEAYTSRRILVGYESSLGHLVREILWTPIVADYTPTLRLWFRFHEQTVRRLRVVRIGGTHPDYWSMSELRVFRAFRELPRDARWRLRANPNNWNVQLAFDNSYATRWRTWQPLSPGMYVEVDFGRPERLDAVVLDCAPEQSGMQLKLEAQADGGPWQALASQPEPGEAPRPVALRSAAAEELKRLGITHLISDPNDVEWNDLRGNPARWGIETVAEAQGLRLYRLR